MDTSSISINCIALIGAPRPNEWGTFRRIAEDLEVVALHRGVLYQECEVCTADELDGAIDALAKAAAKGMSPMVHIDMHGSKSQGLEIGRSGEFYAWSRFANRMRRLNIETKNNVLVVLHSCHGINVAWQVSITKATPWHALVAPSQQVVEGYLERSIPEFVRTLFGSGSLAQAFAPLVDHFTLFHSRSMFVKALEKYVENYACGKGAKLRTEELLTRAISRGAGDASVSMLRKKIKARVRLSQDDINAFCRIFLLLEECPITLEEILARVAMRKS